ncbi:MAG: cytochrome P450 [Acidimicrobiales bacterium]
MDVDLTAPAHDADPFPFFEELRAVGPVVRSNRHRAWLAVTHESVLDGLRAPWLSSDRVPTFERIARSRPASFQAVVDVLRGWMVFRDPPEHTTLREPVRRAFTPRRVADLRGVAEAIADELLGSIAADAARAVALDADYCRPLPALVIAELLGVPATDREAFSRWSDELAAVVFSAEGRGTGEGAATAARHFSEYFTDLAAQRRRRPTDDLISALVHASAVDPADLVGACTLLLFAGHETTAGLIANGTALLLEHPDQLQRLREDPSLWPTAVDELLRRASPAKTMVRKAVEDRRWFDVDVRAGDTVFLVLLAASNDPAAVDDPDRLDVGRLPNPHLGFGWGLHHCLGAALARLEAEVALQRLFDRFPGLRLDGPVRWGGGVLGRAVRLPPLLTG